MTQMGSFSNKKTKITKLLPAAVEVNSVVYELFLRRLFQNRSNSAILVNILFITYGGEINLRASFKAALIYCYTGYFLL